jgi:magnesium chelatase family protein
VVNLRPPHFRKSSSGVDLAVALGFLALTGQLAPEVRTRLEESVVYGELALDGRVFAPHDLSVAMRAVEVPLLSGEPTGVVREGSWWQLNTLGQEQPRSIQKAFDWSRIWRPPEFPDWEFQADAAEALWLTAHMGLNVLLAGPQGSGKSTWARALYALTDQPSPEPMCELLDLFGEDVLSAGWRPFEKPHHSITPPAMIGGGSPLFPGVISRAHGGVLLMDEFLEFDAEVLEALREPIERGVIEHARRGERVRYPAAFQLVATTNLCPCGKLNPEPPDGRPVGRQCSLSLGRCRSVCGRLSGPLMDRFDLVVLSHKWLLRGPRVSFTEVRRRVAQSRAFARTRGEVLPTLPTWVRELELSHRRRNSLLRVARALADRAGRPGIDDEYFHQAMGWVESPMAHITQLFA